MRNPQVAAAVAAVLGLGGYGAAQAAAPPTGAQAAAVPAGNQVFMAGSSAAANAIINYIETTVCGGTGWSAFTTPTSSVGQPDFRAVSCTSALAGLDSGQLVTIWYRPEGGSVVGVFPVVNNTTIKQLNMATGCTLSGGGSTTSTYSCTGVTGTAPGNGTNDTFGGTVLSHNVDIGVSDLEPGVFASTTLGGTNAYAGGGNNDPVSSGASPPTYAASLTGGDFGVDTAENYATVTFQQAFGFIVSANLHTAGVTDLPKWQIKDLFAGSVINWNKVLLGSNAAVSVSAAPVICNRELGSGTRAETDLFLWSDGCVSNSGNLPELQGTSIGGQTQPNDNFQTIAELDCVNSHSNAIGYVSIDNFAKTAAASSSSFPNVWPITIDTVSAYGSAINAATGAYDDWYEASINLNNSASAVGNTFYGDIVTALGSLNANVGSSYQVMAIPDNIPANTATAPLTQGSHGVYVNDFTRSGNSCTVPTHG
jgi:ABC-type phosphate transport system substrate-binding protein